MSDPAVTTHTVLIVDDDASARRIMRATLQRQGLIVVEAANGSEALKAFKQTHADLILIDGNMPVMDGFEATRNIRASEFGGAVPIIMITSLADSDTVKKATAAGITDFVTKPVNWALLGQLILSRLPAAHEETVTIDTASPASQ